MAAGPRPEAVAFDVVGTLFSLEPLRDYLADAGLWERVAEVVSVDEVGLSKPRPEIYRHAVQRAGVAGATCRPDDRKAYLQMRLS